MIADQIERCESCRGFVCVCPGPEVRRTYKGADKCEPARKCGSCRSTNVEIDINSDIHCLDCGYTELPF